MNPKGLPRAYSYLFRVSCVALAVYLAVVFGPHLVSHVHTFATNVIAPPLVSCTLLLASLGQGLVGFLVAVTGLGGGLFGPAGIKLLVFGYFRRRTHPWGVVYDAKTKQPLDPAVVTLTDGSGRQYQAVTDIYGRYDLLASPGEYKVLVSKTGYAFPSSKVRNQQDEIVYDNVLTQDSLVVASQGAVRYNIPMDQVKADWNQAEKSRMGITGPRKASALVAKVASLVGLLWSIAAVLTTPITLNFVLFAVFGARYAYVLHKERTQRWGSVVDTSGKPIAGAVVSLVLANFPKVSGSVAVTDQWGRYQFLVSKGVYKLKVELMESNVRVLVHVLKGITVTHDDGVVARHIVIDKLNLGPCWWVESST